MQHSVDVHNARLNALEATTLKIFTGAPARLVAVTTTLGTLP
jgi:hypothetical protein